MQTHWQCYVYSRSYISVGFKKFKLGGHVLPARTFSLSSMKRLAASITSQGKRKKTGTKVLVSPK